jgi:hypothetical protein
MHRFSESIGAIAAALAKAQLEIPLEISAEPSATLPYQAAWRLRARASAGTRLPSCSQPQLTKKRA